MGRSSNQRFIADFRREVMRQFSLLSIHALADKFEVFGPQTSLFLTADYWTTDSSYYFRGKDMFAGALSKALFDVYVE